MCWWGDGGKEVTQEKRAAVIIELRLRYESITCLLPHSPPTDLLRLERESQSLVVL